MENRPRNAISILVEHTDGAWYGIAYVEERIVATAVTSTKERAVRNLLKAIASNTEHQIVEKGSAFAHSAIEMLRELDNGNEEHKSFDLATEYMPQPDAKVLKTAAAIPIGYVASYGGVAQAADTEAKIVGQIMARNPLYPIVACHRVVGADFSLVGYGGGRSLQALRAKLARLESEAKGFTAKKEVSGDGGSLTVFPVESVLKKNRSIGPDADRQRRLFDY
jgi:O-6-methylguanine DNA methyltransferase